MGYINANRISELIESRLDGLEFMSKDRAEAYEMAIRAALRVIEHAPTADVQSVVHGAWFTDECDDVYCSNCQEEALLENFNVDDEPNAYEKSLFCPHCGAKMDGGNI